MQVVWEVGGSRAAAWGAGCVAVCSAPRSSSAMWLVHVLLPASKCKTEGRGPTCELCVPVAESSCWGLHLGKALVEHRGQEGSLHCILVTGAQQRCEQSDTAKGL